VSRTVSSTFKAAFFGQSTSEVALVLLEIVHTDLPATICLVNNTADVTSNGTTYTAFPFKINVPCDDEDGVIPKVQLEICNVDRSIVEAIRTIDSPPTIRAALILASDPDTVEAGWWEFTLRDTTYTAEAVTGTLTYEDILNDGFPSGSFTPEEFTALA
jgi:hypothetical protein